MTTFAFTDSRSLEAVKAETVEQISALKDELAKLSLHLERQHQKYISKTRGFDNAKQHVEAAWRGLEYAAQQFDN